MTTTTTHECPCKNADGKTPCRRPIADPHATDCGAHTGFRSPAADRAPRARTPERPPVVAPATTDDDVETPDDLDDDGEDEARWVADAESEVSADRVEAERVAREYGQAEATKTERFERIADLLDCDQRAGLVAVVRDDAYNTVRTQCLSCTDPDEVEAGQVDYSPVILANVSLYDECEDCGNEYGEALPADVAEEYGY